jgi:hypothetical protein
MPLSINYFQKWSFVQAVVQSLPHEARAALKQHYKNQLKELYRRGYDETNEIYVVPREQAIRMNIPRSRRRLSTWLGELPPDYDEIDLEQELAAGGSGSATYTNQQVSSPISESGSVVSFCKYNTQQPNNIFNKKLLTMLSSSHRHF